MRVLLIEDEEAISKEIREGLVEQRFRVEVAADGLSGLEMADQGGYAVILLDVMLPKLPPAPDQEASLATVPIHEERRVYPGQLPIKDTNEFHG